MRTMNVKKMVKLAQSGLLAVLLLAALSCESRTDRTDGGGVLLSISDFEFGNIMIPIPVNREGLYVQAESITIRNVAKNSSVDTSDLMDVELDSYQVIYRRVDRGNRTPPPYVSAMFGTVPVGGTFEIGNFTLVGPEQLRNPPLSDLLFVNGAVDDETGSQIISVEAEITVFGRTLSGDAVASAPVRTRLDFSP